MNPKWAIFVLEPVAIIGLISRPTISIPIDKASTITVPIPQQGSIARIPTGFGIAILTAARATRVVRAIE
ncbi:hypothetical protein D3C81_2315660 [compost metagenome]